MNERRTGLAARSSAVTAAMTASSDKGGSTRKVPSKDKETSVEKPIGLSVRLTTELHEALRKIAYEQRVSIHSLLLEGVETVIRKYSK